MFMSKQQPSALQRSEFVRSDSAYRGRVLSKWIVRPVISHCMETYNHGFLWVITRLPNHLPAVQCPYNCGWFSPCWPVANESHFPPRRPQAFEDLLHKGLAAAQEELARERKIRRKHREWMSHADPRLNNPTFLGGGSKKTLQQ